jgi:hypothetical protein
MGHTHYSTTQRYLHHQLEQIECPLLFAKHVGCLGSTEEGFNDAAAAFSEAKTVSVEEAPLSSPKFAEALREFCEDVLARRTLEPGRGAET